MSKGVDATKIVHENSKDLLLNVLQSVPEVRFVSKIDEALEKRGLTQLKLSKLCGLRPSTISEITKCSRNAITKSHIAAIMIALRITDIKEILNIEFDMKTIQTFDKERENWIENGVVPTDVAALYAENSKAMFNPDINA